MTATRRHSPRGFTLIELVVVMMLLATVLAFAAPRLTGFTKGREVEEEIRRLAALTRFARETAIGEGERMELWLDGAEGTYGLRAQDPYAEIESRTYKVAAGLAWEVEQYPLLDGGRGYGTPASGAGGAQSGVAIGTRTAEEGGRGEALREDTLGAQEAVILYWPDGSIDELSPLRLVLREEEKPVRALELTANRLEYVVVEVDDAR